MRVKVEWISLWVLIGVVGLITLSNVHHMLAPELYEAPETDAKEGSGGGIVQEDEIDWVNEGDGGLYAWNAPALTALDKGHGALDPLPQWMKGEGEPPECDSACQKHVSEKIAKKEARAEQLISDCEATPFQWPKATPTLILVAGWPEDEKSLKFKDGDIIGESLKTFLNSIAVTSHTGTDVIMLTNPTGVVKIRGIWANFSSEVQARVRLRIKVIDIAKLLEQSAQMYKVGVTVPFVFRLWQLPKFWLGKLLPKSVKRGIVIDLDTHLSVDTGLLWQRWLDSVKTVKDQDPKHCLVIGAVPEVGNTVKDHQDFHDIPHRYINSGVLLVDFEAMRRVEFYDTLVDVAMYRRSAPRRPNPSGQWPPEQWMFNALFAHFLPIMYPLHKFWNLNCLHLANAVEDQFAHIPYNISDFRLDAKQAFILHYCGGSTYERFREAQ